MILDVVGGAYREYCKEGEWRQLYGSGLRAAASLQNEAEIRLHTYIGGNDQHLLDAIADTFTIKVCTATTANTILFSYDHGLSTPHIFPPLQEVATSPPICVSADRVLRFGMVEGQAVVDGDMVAYDPQSAYSPELYRKNGSSAKRLVIVCNRREVMYLTDETDVAVAASKLRSLDGAEAVIVKCGSHGALLISDLGQQHIPAFRTNRVWPIGSGDIFAATFFTSWVQGASHFDAAMMASRATAHYCESRSLPLPPLASELPDYAPLNLRDVNAGSSKPKVYLAGPFFNMGQRWIVHEARDALVEQGMSVFSPFHDVGFGVASDVVPADIEGLRDSDVVLALLDHLDSGTLFEVGYARCLEKPVVGFCQNTPEETLKMLYGTKCDVVDDFVSAIYHTAWAAFKA